MRIILLLLCVICFSIQGIVAQEKKWLDLNEFPTSKDKAVYYRVSSNDKKEKELIIFFYVSGIKAKEFYFVNGKKEGKFILFYSTGEVKILGKYEDGIKEGIWKEYYKNGKIKEKGKYKNDVKKGVWKIFYKHD